MPEKDSDYLCSGSSASSEMLPKRTGKKFRLFVPGAAAGGRPGAGCVGNGLEAPRSVFARASGPSRPPVARGRGRVVFGLGAPGGGVAF